MIYLTVFVILCYTILIIWLTYGFFTTSDTPATLNSDFSTNISVSIVVALRNEKNNIDGLMCSLLSQRYKSIEILLVDDDSTDGTLEKLREYKDVKIYSSKGGKKAAIALGVRNAIGDIVVTTDADCRAGENWIVSIVNCYLNNNRPKLILAPVSLHGDSIFGDIQALEFATLIASTCGSTKMNNAVMCNAANMAFEREMYYEVDLCDKYTSGDDMFLLQSVKLEYGAANVIFLKAKDAIVNTYAKDTIKDFIRQRMRWTSKAGGYRDNAIISVAIIILSYCFLNIMLLLGGLFFHEYLYLGLLMLGIKSVIDLPIVTGICIFMNQKKLLMYYIIEQFLYILYIPFISISSYIKNKMGYSCSEWDKTSKIV